MNILLADDEQRVRSALRLILQQETNLTIMGEVNNVTQILDYTDAQMPDLVLLDWELPGGGGANVLTALRIAEVPPAVIALSGRPEALTAALEAGADATVCKTEPPECLLAAIKSCTEKR